MANNCLVTKLKAVVNNDNLPFMDAFNFPVKAIAGTSKGFYASPIAGSTVNLRGGSGVLFSNDGTNFSNPLTNANDVYIYLKNPSGQKNVGIMPYSNIDGIMLTQFSADYYKTVLSDGMLPEDYIVDLRMFVPCINISYLRLDYCEVTGNIEDLGVLTKLETLVLYHGNFTGDIVNMVKSWISNGRTDYDQMNFILTTRDIIRKTLITFNGHTMPNYTASVGGQNKLGWESENKIYYKFSNDNKDLYCIGYSDGEIATKTATGGAWEGFTVTKCD